MLPRTAQFTEIYERHHRFVLAYCLRRTGESDAYDAASEVFSVAWRRLDSIPGGEKQLAWLYGVARNVLSRQRRSQGRFLKLARRLAMHPQASDPGVEHLVTQRIENARLAGAAAQLSDPDQEILRLAAWEGLPHTDIAHVLNISVTAVDQRFHRAKKRLAIAFDETGATGAHSQDLGGTA